MIVIIGGGPAALYAAIVLKKNGIKDLALYDPRAGQYTRPGHLSERAFKRAEKGIGKKFWFKDHGHIKDFERHLYDEVLRLGIRVEQKKFVGLHQNGSSPGVYVEDALRHREWVKADYVFDCTGSARVVVHAVNESVQPPPFQLKSIGNVPVTHHFLAYVRMSQSDFDTINSFGSHPHLQLQGYLSPEHYARIFLKLNSLGWKEMFFPRCYGISFGNDKACFYMQAPEGLPFEQYDDWVQSTFDCFGVNITYDHIAPSKKYPNKPRFLPFTADAKKLEKVSYTSTDLPTIIALGDAQIDPDYYLAHGIYNGMARIDALLDVIIIMDGKIYYFDPEEYQSRLNSLLNKHQTSLIEEYASVKEYSVNALRLAQKKIPESILVSSIKKSLRLQWMLERVNGLCALIAGREEFHKIHYPSGHLKIDSMALDTLENKLQGIEVNVKTAFHCLPLKEDEARKEAHTLLLQLAASWKSLGNVFFKTANLDQAIEAYNTALSIFESHIPIDQCLAEVITLCSNLSISHFKNRDYAAAIQASQQALATLQGVEPESEIISAALREKIVFNLNQAMCAQIKTLASSGHWEESQLLHDEATAVLAHYGKTMGSNNLVSARNQLAEATIKRMEIKDEMPMRP